MANRIVQITDEYGDYIYPLCGEGLVMPAFTTKGTITTGTPSGGSLVWMHLRYGFTSDKNIGFFSGELTAKGTGASNKITLPTGLSVGTAPSSLVQIYGPMSTTASQTSQSTTAHIEITTAGAINLIYYASTNNTTFWIPPMTIRFSDFY